MTPEKLKSVFVQYRAILDVDYPGIDPKQLPEGLMAAPTREWTLLMRGAEEPWQAMAAHYKFMCDEAQRFVDAGHVEKAMRWLGFLQGAFWRVGRFTLDDLKNHSRPDAPTEG